MLPASSSPFCSLHNDYRGLKYPSRGNSLYLFCVDSTSDTFGQGFIAENWWNFMGLPLYLETQILEHAEICTVLRFPKTRPGSGKAEMGKNDKGWDSYAIVR